jgi:hypothetical protein
MSRKSNLMAHLTGAEEDYAQACRVILDHVASWPAEDQARFKAHLPTETSLDGTTTFALDDEALGPWRARQLRRILSGIVGPVSSHLSKVEEELQSHRNRMGEDPAGWGSDDKSQIRFRVLLRHHEWESGMRETFREHFKLPAPYWIRMSGDRKAGKPNVYVPMRGDRALNDGMPDSEDAFALCIRDASEGGRSEGVDKETHWSLQ